MSGEDNISLDQFSDEELASERERLQTVASKKFGDWRDTHERMGFRFQDSKMSYEYGAKTDLDWTTHQPVTADGVEPEHLYRVEGREGMKRLQETGELASSFGGSSAYTHVSRFPEGKYADRDTNVLQIKNVPGRFRGKQTLDRGYAVAEQPIPASDVKDLGPSPTYKAWGAQKRAASKPVPVEDYAPITPEGERLGDVISEQLHRPSTRQRSLSEIFGGL